MRAYSRLTAWSLATLVAGWAFAAQVPKEEPREGHIGVVKDGEVLLLRPNGEVVFGLKASWR